ncbi:MAG TPA: carboxypeptidase-like regulatory domain-containing protein, partial [Pyrinomonadaceae bacterium]|nr:carboxypeptidase-like regulatory domain-containing protein [Pyrinomonadaceae bacterium]
MKRLFFTLLIACLVPAAALAQSSAGSLVGTVSDASGVIPNATVVVKDKLTGKERTVQTSGQGGFTVPDLDVGLYTVTVKAAGHKTHISTDVKMDAGKDYSLPVTMEVGEVSENVTVVAGAEIINSSDAQLATNIGPRQLLELPLLTRNPLALILTSSGAASNPSQGTSINGQRTSSTNIVRDGININDNFIRSNATDFAPQRPSVDDIAEFTISSQNSADGGFGAGQLTLATPRGSNGFHGAVFEYNRNSKFAANSFFNNATGSYAANDPLVLAGLRTAGAPKNPRPFRNRNQFGGKISGPILKNKLFFFTYYEGLRDRVTSNKLTTTLLPAALTGGFTYNRSDNGALQTVNILAPAFGTGITGVDPTVQARILSRLPLGNTTESGDLRNTTGYRFSQQANQDRDSFTTRIDYDINAKHSINGVYNHVKEGNLRTDIDGSFNTTPVATQPSTNNFLSLGYRAILSSRLTNELTGGFFKSVPVFHSSEPAKTNNFIIPTLVT